MLYCKLHCWGMGPSIVVCIAHLQLTYMLRLGVGVLLHPNPTHALHIVLGVAQDTYAGFAGTAAVSVLSCTVHDVAECETVSVCSQLWRMHY